MSAHPLGPVATLAAGVVAVLAGLLVGATGSFVQAAWLGPLPLGLLVGLAGSAGVVAFAALLGRSRLLPVAATVGWLVAVVPLAGSRTEGDLVVAGDTVGYVWAYGGMALVAATCLASIAVRVHTRSRSDPPG